MTPKRIHRKPFDVSTHANTIYVGPGSRWENPFVVGKDGTAQECISKFVNQLLPYTHKGPQNSLTDFFISDANLSEIIADLGGKNLSCSCKLDEPCHADALLKLAN